MRITRRLGVLVAVPLAAVSGFGAVALTASAGDTMRGAHLWSLMHTSTAAGRLICELQDERTMMALLLTGPDARPTADVEAQIAQTDAAIDAYRQQVRALAHSPQTTRDLLARIDEELTGLSSLRLQIRSEAAPALSAVVFQYRIAIADLARFREAVASAGSAPQQISAQIHTANLLYQAAEATGQEESDVLRSAAGLPMTPAAVSSIARDRQVYGDAMEAFDTQAPAVWHERPDEAMTTPDILLAQQYEDQVSRLGAGDVLHLDKNAWARSMSARRDVLDRVRADMDLDTLTAIGQLRDDARDTAEIEAAAIAGTALLVIMFSLRLGRPMIRGLRQLRDAANAVAFERLPAAVEELRATESLTGRSPEEFAEQAGDALTLGGPGPGGRRRNPISPDDEKDELAAVARAFNSVHREAIRTAAEQVLLRAGVGATFVALARRGERLTGALTSELDRAERAEQDPDRLARLFVLDHLVARMTRNNDSLLVLGGEGTARVRDRGVPLLDVTRAALGRVERYTRVDLDGLDPGVVIEPQAVDHLVHLLAELLDNATTFSSPGSRVTVEAQAMADRVVVRVCDRGIGMTPARRGELNTRLAALRPVDSETVRAMGLTVVAHLAAWYSIEVYLRARPGGGTIAEVGLPLTVVASRGADDRALTFGTVSEGTPLSALGQSAAVPEADWPELPFADAEETESGLDSAARPVADLTADSPAVRANSTADSPATRAADGPAVVSAALGEAAGATAVESSAAAPYPASELPFGPLSPDLRPAPTYTEPASRLAGRPDHGPAPESAAEAPAADPTTVNGLPVRIPQTRLPKEARRGAAQAAQTDTATATADAHADRDPERVAATMAAYARGLTGRTGGGPKP